MKKYDAGELVALVVLALIDGVVLREKTGRFDEDFADQPLLSQLVSDFLHVRLND
jgi:hypothetical protein